MVYCVALLLLVDLVLGGDEVLPDGVSRLEVHTYAPFGQNPSEPLRDASDVRQGDQPFVCYGGSIVLIVKL